MYEFPKPSDSDKALGYTVEGMRHPGTRLVGMEPFAVCFPTSFPALA